MAAKGPAKGISRPLTGRPTARPTSPPDSPARRNFIRQRDIIQRRGTTGAGSPIKQTLAQIYGMNPDDPNAFAGPMTLRQGLRTANAEANLKYGAQLGTLNTQIKEAPKWYQDYKDSVAGARTAAQTYQQGLMDQSNNVANQVGQAVLGSLQDQQAAQSRKALANAGTNLLANMGAANDAYFGSQNSTADASKIATMSNLLTQKRQTQGAKGDFQASALNDLRTQATNSDIARQTLGANVMNQQADNKLARQALKTKTKTDAQARKQTQSLATQKINSQQSIATQRVRSAQSIAAGRVQAVTQKAAAKQEADQSKATHNIRTRIHDATMDYNRISSTQYPIKGAKGKAPKTRKPTRNEVVAQLRKDGYTPTEIDTMLTLNRPGGRLGPHQIQALHDQDPNIRVPRNWKTPRKPKLGSNAGDLTAGGAGGGSIP